MQGYEIDFLPVGEEGQSGDAIALRFGNLYDGQDGQDKQTVVVIDGGFEENGEALVEHVRKYYRTARINLVISTHPDGDHIGGLKVVLNEMRVDRLWMHRPWRRSHIANQKLYSGLAPTQRMRASLQRSLRQAHELEQLAEKKNIPIDHPFAGLEDATGRLLVLGPTEQLYSELLTEYLETQEQISSARANPLTKFMKAGKDVLTRVMEQWNLETLTDECATSPQNESSVVLLLRVAGQRLLFTADAGPRALGPVVSILEHHGICPSGLHFVQVPHHGSRRNVGPTLLNRLLGPRQPRSAAPTCSSFASAAKKGAPKHPSKKVANAFKRRGAAVCATQGGKLCHYYNAPSRPGWSTATPLPFYHEVEDLSAD